VIDQPRSSQRYQTRPREGEAELLKRMLELVKQHPRYGYRFVWARLREEGFKTNRKRDPPLRLSSQIPMPDRS